MKKNVLALSCAVAAFFMVSCGSTPVAEPEPEVKDVVEEIKTEAEEVKTEVQQTVDFSAENAMLLAMTEASREKAIQAEAKKYYSEGFDAAEAAYLTIKNDIAANPSTDYSEQIKDLTARYDSLAAASQAQALKEKAESLSLGGEDKASAEAGEKALSEYAALGTSASGKDLLAKAQEALEAYSNVVNKGLKANAARERAAALVAKKNADSVKAGVARKDDYKKASDTFKKADSSYVTANIEGAYLGYKASREAFEGLYNDIAAKRAAAQALIDAAKQKVQASESYAEEADTIAPLEGEVAGIEKEDTVLLEEDNLANPDEAVIDVEEGVTAQAAGKAAETAIALEESVTETAASVETAETSETAEAAATSEAN